MPNKFPVGGDVYAHHAQCLAHARPTMCCIRPVRPAGALGRAGRRGRAARAPACACAYCMHAAHARGGRRHLHRGADADYRRLTPWFGLLPVVTLSCFARVLAAGSARTAAAVACVAAGNVSRFARNTFFPQIPRERSRCSCRLCLAPRAAAIAHAGVASTVPTSVVVSPLSSSGTSPVDTSVLHDLAGFDMVPAKLIWRGPGIHRHG